MDENKKSQRALSEEKVLEFWKENEIFKKSLEKDAPKGEYIFYEGPPTANGKPGIHHLEARAFKDAIPRYKTMRGYHVRRKGGWDTHGLPVELQVEKKLNLNSKKAIEEYGIARFNKECKESVWEYTDLWSKFTDRIGYWVDQENAYVTYHNDYIESVWNVVKTADEKKLLYKDYKVVPWCPRCGTVLSSHELAQGYQDVKDLSVYVKFKIKNESEGRPISVSGQTSDTNETPVFILAWTTTPWTLPGNVALAVGKDIEYVKIKRNNEFLIVAKNRLVDVFKEDNGNTTEFNGSEIKFLKGSDLIGLEYEPLYPYLSNTISDTERPKLEKAFKIYPASFVNTEDGTGVVHTAVMYGVDDFNLGNEIGLPKHHMVGLDGKFFPGADFLTGRFVRDEEVAVDIIKDLAHRGLLFKKEKYEHSYPHCWRCKTALIYYARDSWYLRMSELRDKLVKENKNINWEPSYIKEGRFGEWLSDIKDWAISRERYWGTPLPIWICNDCNKREVLGSIEDIKLRSKKVNGEPTLPVDEKGNLDLHKPYIDEVELVCKCGGKLERVKEVMDVWLDSGCMPFAQDHYPFENKKFVDKSYPADFICEAIDQTRGWFYTLHAVGVIMGKGNAYRNVICLGHLLDAKGKKMSKSLGNVVDPWIMMDKYGADTIRLWMYSVNQPGESKNFDEKTVSELNSKIFNLLYNILAFYELYRDKSLEEKEYKESKNILDKWIISRLSELTENTTKQLDGYKLLEPVRAIRDFIDDLSTWYLRRSRERIKNGDAEAKMTLYFVIKNLIKLMAPFTPFASEDIWQKLKTENDEESVHLTEWPTFAQGYGEASQKIISEMQKVREVVTLGLQERQKAGIPVRQPLSMISIPDFKFIDQDEMIDIIRAELNIWNIFINKELKDTVSINFEITKELKQEGNYRELVRAIQDLRKKEGLSPNDVITLEILTSEEGEKIINKFKLSLMKTVIAKDIQIKENNGTEIKIDSISFTINLIK